MPQLFPKEVFQECPENLPTCCHMGSACGPPERSCKRSTLREIPVCESQPQDIIHHLWCILGSTASSPSKHASDPANFAAYLLCVREPALGDKRLPGLQGLGSPWGNKARTLKHLVSKVRCRIYRGRAGKGHLEVFVFGKMRGRNEPPVLQGDVPADFRLLFQGPQAFPDRSGCLQIPPRAQGKVTHWNLRDTDVWIFLYIENQVVWRKRQALGLRSPEFHLKLCCQHLDKLLGCVMKLH